ncbi:hypothetical protein LTR36_005193 [Oleoguttula mirabilis]|uniref:Uncharacterized protein n=1 Tax=Oleoguttula mirabilis TaxID=1507867 RepID=A0AAV9JWJ0_9PEZI|nr:hypothetical protein LTR36_005193 [Oleoguttula mirabilis]
MSDSSATVTSASLSSSVADVSSSLAAAITSSVASAVSSAVLSTTSAPAPPADSTTTVEGTTNVVTSIISASSVAATTNIITSVVTQSAVSNGVTDTSPVTVIITSVNTPSTTAVVVAGATSGTSSSATSTSSSPATISNSGESGGSGGSSGLSTGGKTAVAVVVPVVVVALLVLAGIFLWRRRKQRKDEQEARRKEVEDYGFNPNHDPTLPTVAADGVSSEMAQDSNGGYRGWGAAGASTRQPSTTLSGGHTQGQLSDSGNSYGHTSSSPGVAGSDGHSGDPLVNRRETMNSDDLGALGAAPVASSNQPIRRGPSNASSAYSGGARSDGSDEPVPNIPDSIGQAHDYNPQSGYGYSQHGPYGDGSYGGGQDSNGMPVVRDVSARRNTRIQQGGGYGQGASGIAQNF